MTAQKKALTPASNQSIFKNQDNSNILFTKYSSEGYLTKIIWYDDVIQKSSFAVMRSGEYETVEVKSLREFVSVLDGLGFKQAAGYGVAKQPAGEITTKKNEGVDGAISRSKANFSFSDSPGIFMVDIDPRGPTDRLTAQQAHSQLVQAMPELAQVEMVCRGSASSSIYASKDFMDLKQDHELIPEGGWHFYFVVDEASEIPRIGEILGKRLWLNGKGYILISGYGSQLVRCLADTCVWQGERLDFAAGAKCLEPLERRPPPPVYFGSEKMLISKAVKTLTAVEERRCKRLIEAEKASTKGAAMEKHERWLEARIPPGITRAEKDVCKQVLEQSINGCALPLDYRLHLNEKETVLVREMLSNPGKYDSKIICDPLEPEYRGWSQNTTVSLKGYNAELCSWSHGERTIFTLQRFSKKNTTPITIIDRPCGVGKTTGLLSELKKHRVNHPAAKILLVVPELSEITRYLESIGKWFHAPVVDPVFAKEGGPSTKAEVLVELMQMGKNIVMTHALYASGRKFQHLLHKYHVVIDEVPVAAKEVRANFGKGVFKHLLYDKKYIEIDRVTKLITSTANWLMDKDDYTEKTDKDIARFMQTVTQGDVYSVNETFQVMPLPDAFFTEPKGLTIMTFLFDGTQLDHYMRSRGYEYSIQKDTSELINFKHQLNNNLLIYAKSSSVKTGFVTMTSKKPDDRKKVGNFVKNTIQRLRNGGFDMFPDRVLIASHKDAWYGKEKDPTSKVTKKNRLKTLTKLGKATYTSMITRGTNKYRHLDVIVIMGTVNMNPGLADFLGMRSRKAQDAHAISELLQLIYRTALRDGEFVILISVDLRNIRLIREFLETPVTTKN